MSFKTLMIGTVASGCSVAFATQPWHISGTLSEVCSCGVPCTCNFGQSPDKSYCYAVIGMTIQHGSYGSTKLDRLHFGGAQGAKGFAFYVDSSASPTQREALEEILHEIWWKGLLANGITDKSKIPDGYAFLGVKPAHMTHVVTAKGNDFEIDGAGGFSTDFLMGFDGKTPITLENNTTFNIKRSIKGKSQHLNYKDSYGNEFKFAGTNGNHGHFDWTDKTPVYMK